MGDYADVEIAYAESDFSPEEREFMGRLWERFYAPEAAIGWGRPDAYEAREALRKEVHAEMRLPGTEWDWRFILTREIHGRRYYMPIDSLKLAMIPPFPRRFADITRLREKYGIRPTWYALFSATDGLADGVSFVADIGAARKRFIRNFQGTWRLIYSGWGEEDLEAMEARAPAGSEDWALLGKVFERFPFHHYRAVLELLADDHGRDALIELSCGSILYNYDGDYKKAWEMVRAEHASATRVFEALGRLDVAALRGEPLLELSRSYRGSGAGPWLEASGHEDLVRGFRKYITNESEWE
jgi:hypothetical protein